VRGVSCESSQVAERQFTALGSNFSQSKSNTMNQNTQVAPASKKDIRALIQSDQVKQQMAMVLPKHLTADRMARVACTAILKTPKLATCRPESLLQALMLCSQAGLEPDGRNAHLIPYGDIVQVIFDWKGIVALARRNGVQNIFADVVCENDLFAWDRDADGLHFQHKVDWRKPRGGMFAAYCIWKDADQFDGEVMTKDEIDTIRKRSKASGSGPWVTDYNEMAKKTVVRRASKKWPLDAELAEAVNNDADSLPKVQTSPAMPNFAPALPEPEDNVDLSPSEVVQEPAPAPVQPPEAPKPVETPSATQKPARGSAATAQAVLEGVVTKAGFAFEDFRAWVSGIGLIPDADSFGSFAELPEAGCKAAIRSQTSMLAQLKEAKGV
jgi:recombination protein RecT